MARKRFVRRAVTSVPVLLLSVGIVFGLAAGAVADRRPEARHLWRRHLAPQAKKVFFTKPQVTTRIERAVASPEPDTSATETPPAEQDEDESTPVLLPWVQEGGFEENWWQGLGYALLGFLGALVTIYLFLGESLPSMGGKADYESLRLELEDFKARREKVLRGRESYARGETDDVSSDRLEMQNGLSDDYDTAITRLEGQLSRERWRLYLMGFPMYLILGGAFAVLFATNALQAILIGFGWTALADRLGLKRELEAKKEKKDKQIQELEDVATEQTKRAQEGARGQAELQARLEASENERKILQKSNDILTRRLAGDGADNRPQGGQ